MTGWTIHEGTALALPLDNVDTDQLIPARFMSQPRKDGYGDFLLHDLRRAGEMPDPAFPLNAHPGASVLVAGRNFGSGSSREAAVYALVDAGFRAVLAPSFGDIFSANAVNNGLLPCVIDTADLLAACATPQPARIDLPARQVMVAGRTLRFDLRDNWAQKLANGWDDIDLTRQHGPRIETFRDQRRRRPGAWPAPPRG